MTTPSSTDRWENESLQKTKIRGQPRKNPVPVDDEIVPLSQIRCKQRLGGLLNIYSRKAA
jgi:hypothetical protein